MTPIAARRRCSYLSGRSRSEDPGPAPRHPSERRARPDCRASSDDLTELLQCRPAI